MTILENLITLGTNFDPILPSDLHKVGHSTMQSLSYSLHPKYHPLISASNYKHNMHLILGMDELMGGGNDDYIKKEKTKNNISKK